MLLSLKGQDLLPSFRTDLVLYKGPVDAEGAPTYSLYDPLKDQYYKINWRQHLILKSLRPKMTLNELYRELHSQASIKITPEDIKTFFTDALRYDLLQIRKSSDQLNKEVKHSKLGYLKTLFYHYLYFKVPILQPDKFLNATAPIVRPLVSPLALIIYALLTITGLSLLIDRFPEYINTFTHFFNFHGILIYILAILFFKSIHEFAHAYTANYFQVRVPSMGVVFILGAPRLYTDTTDGWKLSRRSERIKISAAGLLAELVLAGIATLGWALSPPGVMQSTFFVISSVVWLSSIFINMNPAMRYDGYYLLCDIIKVDNLQPRAFTMTRWWIRHTLLGMDIPSPEPQLSRKMTIFFIVYTIYTWIYLFLFYLSIAIIFYLFNKQAKVAAIFFLIFTVTIFLIIPIIGELIDLFKVRHKVKKVSHVTATLFCIILLSLVFFMPMSEKFQFEAIVIPAQTQKVYIPDDSIIKKVYVKRGDQVKMNEPLLQLTSPQNEAEIREKAIEEKSLKKEIANLAFRKSDDFQKFAEKKRQLQLIQAQMNKLSYTHSLLTIRSEFDGSVTFWDEDLAAGQWVSKGHHIATLASPSLEVVAYVPEDTLAKITLKQPATFTSHESFMTYTGHLSNIHGVPATYLEHPLLAKAIGAELPPHYELKNDEKVKLKESVYPIEFTFDDLSSNHLHIGELGTLKATGTKSSYFDLVTKKIRRLLWRESEV